MSPIICGGGNDNNVFGDCLLIGKNNPKVSMLQRRRDAACVVLNKNILWVVGGWGGDFSDAENRDLNTTECLSLNQFHQTQDTKHELSQCFSSRAEADPRK